MKVQGNVIGPTFNFDTPELQFGIVPYGFPTTKTLSMTNSSFISMDYVLSLVPMPELNVNDFVINPATGTLDALQTGNFKITFNPSRVGDFQVLIQVDVLNVGKNLLRLPLTAQSIVPPV